MTTIINDEYWMYLFQYHKIYIKNIKCIKNDSTIIYYIDTSNDFDTNRRVQLLMRDDTIVKTLYKFEKIIFSKHNDFFNFSFTFIIKPWDTYEHLDWITDTDEKFINIKNVNNVKFIFEISKIKYNGIFEKIDDNDENNENGKIQITLKPFSQYEISSRHPTYTKIMNIDDIISNNGEESDIVTLPLKTLMHCMTYNFRTHFYEYKKELCIFIKIYNKEEKFIIKFD